MSDKSIVSRIKNSYNSTTKTQATQLKKSKRFK